MQLFVYKYKIMGIQSVSQVLNPYNLRVYETFDIKTSDLTKPQILIYITKYSDSQQCFVTQQFCTKFENITRNKNGNNR